MGNNFYSKEDIEALTVQDEEKSYSRKVSFDCQYEKEVKVAEDSDVFCLIKNIGNTKLDNVLFCLGNSCENINLPINQQSSAEITVNETEAGWHSIIVSAKNELIDKKCRCNTQHWICLHWLWKRLIRHQWITGSNFK